MFALSLHHQPHHIIAVWLLASASVFILFESPKGPYSPWHGGFAGWAGAWGWALAGASVTASVAGYIPLSGGAALAVVFAVVAAPFTCYRVAANRRYWRAVRAGIALGPRGGAQ